MDYKTNIPLCSKSKEYKKRAHYSENCPSGYDPGITLALHERPSSNKLVNLIKCHSSCILQYQQRQLVANYLNITSASAYLVPFCIFCTFNVQRHIFRQTKVSSYKPSTSLWSTWSILLLAILQLLFQLIPFTMASSLDSTANFPPRFASQPGDSAEIVLRIKEGPSSLQREIYRLVGEDPDPGDQLQFGVLSVMGADLLRIENHSPIRNQASVYLRKELDRETQDSYHLVLTLTDGKLGKGNYITKTMLIIVEDVNDNEPVFKPFKSTVHLSEFTNPGRLVEVVEAVDQDEGRFGQVFYSLEEVDREADAADTFAIETRNGKGIISLISNLDFERKSLYQLRIIASDRAMEGERKTSSATLLVRVQDEEDQPPVFTFVPPITRLAESAQVGSPVLRVHAVDGDRGVNRKIRYSIVQGDADLFAIHPSSGVLSVAGELDREAALAQSSGGYVLGIQATEIASNQTRAPISTKTELTIILEDVNDQQPRFASPAYEAEINENAQLDTPVRFLLDLPEALNRVFDLDQGSNGTFRLSIRGEGATNFEITPSLVVNEAWFVVKVKNSSALDFERIQQFQIQLVATELTPSIPPRSLEVDPTLELGNDGRYSSIANLRIYVRDMNDNFPQFEREQYRVSVSENASAGTVLCTIRAFDVDTGIFGTLGIRYTEIQGEIASRLQLDAESGVISVRPGGAQLDRETNAHHYLTVEARDNNGAGNRNTVQLLLQVLDVNDNAPRFLQERYEARLYENELHFQGELQFRALDADQVDTDNAKIRYRLLDDQRFSRYFQVDERSGRLRVRTALDFETIPPLMLANNRTFHSSTSEHLKNKKNESLDFSTSTIDRPDVKNFTLTVRAYDLGQPSLHSDVPLIIYVFDRNDHPPQFERTEYSASVFEDIPGGQQIVRVFAVDGDQSSLHSRVNYRIVRGAGDRFVIDADSGWISLANGASLDIERNGGIKLHRLQVLSVDGGSPLSRSESAQATVLIQVLDINNKPPTFGSLKPLFLSEDAPVGHVVGRVIAMDPDLNAQLRYSLEMQQSEARDEHNQPVSLQTLDGCFTLGQIDGLLRVAKALDRETWEIARLGVHVRDINATGGDRQEDRAIQIVRLLDVNDNRPTFSQSIYRAKVTENAPAETFILSARATDPDVNKTLRYSLEGASAELLQLLRVEPTSGEIRVHGRIDRELHAWLNLSIRATDSGLPPLSGISQLRLQVLDENDNNPQFLSSLAGEHGKLWISSNLSLSLTDSSIVAKAPHSRNSDFVIENQTSAYDSSNGTELPELLSVREDTPVGSSLVQLRAVDADQGEFGQLTYLLDASTAGGTFKLDKKTGWLKLALPLDRERKAEYELLAQALDNYELGYANGECRRAFKRLRVRVLDVNDQAPRLITSFLPNGCVEVSELAVIGQTIGQLTAVDNDEPGTPNSMVRFQLLEGHGLFALAKDDQEPNMLNSGSGSNGAKLMQFMSRANAGSSSEAMFGGEPTLNPLQPAVNAIAESSLEPTSEQLLSNGLFFGNRSQLTQIRLLTTSPLREKVGNYTLKIRLSDQGFPRQQSEAQFRVCVIDVNDHAPRFLFPPANYTIRVPENTTSGSELLRLRAEDADHGLNAIVHYRLRQLPDGHWNAFELDSLTGLLRSRQPFDRERQKHYALRVEAFDLGTPSSLSTDLDVHVLVTNIDDHEPEFTQDVQILKFSENRAPGEERRRLLDTVDRDEEDEDRTFDRPPPCYYLVGGDGSDRFELDVLTHELTPKVRLDREEKANYSLIVQACNDCLREPKRVDRFDSADNSLLRLDIRIMDENDNAPQFLKKVFTGGVTTESRFGTSFMQVRAVDLDEGENGQLRYEIIGLQRASQAEFLDSVGSEPFVIDSDTGEISLNFDPQKDMKGYFEFDVRANDSGGLSDMAQVKIYLLREDQRVLFVLRLTPQEIRERLEKFRDVLANITGAIVNVDNYKFHTNEDGSVDKLKTDLYLHFVNPSDNMIMDVKYVLTLIDKNIDYLDELYKDFNVLLSKPTSEMVYMMPFDDQLKVGLMSFCAFLLLLIVLISCLCLNQRNRYERKLRAATASAFTVHSPQLGVCNVPNTNMHANEGSNPIWMTGYDNEWFKEDEQISGHNQEGNSLDENAISDAIQHCSLTIDSFNHSGSESSSAGNESNGTSNDQQALCQNSCALNVTGRSNVITKGQSLHGKSTLKLCTNLNNNHQILVNNGTGIGVTATAVIGSQFPGQLITSKSSVSGNSSNFLEHSEISCKNSRNTLYIGPSVNGSPGYMPNLHMVSNIMNLETTEL